MRGYYTWLHVHKSWETLSIHMFYNFLLNIEILPFTYLILRLNLLHLKTYGSYETW